MPRPFYEPDLPLNPPQPAPAPPAADGPWSDFKKPAASTAAPPAPNAQAPSGGPWEDFQKPPEEESKFKTVGRGLLQGAVLDPVEGVGQFAEWLSGHKIPIPQHVRDYFDEVQQKVRSTKLGTGSEIASAVGSVFVDPWGAIGLVPRGLELAGLAGRGAEAARTVNVARAMAPAEVATAAKGAENVYQGARASNAIPRIREAERIAERPLTREEQIEVTMGGKGPAPPPKPPGPAGIAGRTAAHTIGGAAYAGAQPVEEPEKDYGKKKLEQVGLGALGGAVGGTGLASRGLSSMARHVTQHPAKALAELPGVAVLHWLLGASPYTTLPYLAAMLGAAGLEKAGPHGVRAVGAGAGQAVGQTQ